MVGTLAGDDRGQAGNDDDGSDNRRSNTAPMVQEPRPRRVFDGCGGRWTISGTPAKGTERLGHFVSTIESLGRVLPQRLHDRVTERRWDLG